MLTLYPATSLKVFVIYLDITSAMTMLTGQSDGDNASVEGCSSQVGKTATAVIRNMLCVHEVERRAYYVT